MTEKKRFNLIDKKMHEISGKQFTELMHQYYMYIDKYTNDFVDTCKEFKLNTDDVLFWFETVRTHKNLTFKNIG